MNQSRCVGSLALDDFMRMHDLILILISVLIFLAVVIEKTVFQSHKIQVGEWIRPAVFISPARRRIRPAANHFGPEMNQSSRLKSTVLILFGPESQCWFISGRRRITSGVSALMHFGPEKNQSRCLKNTVLIHFGLAMNQSRRLQRPGVDYFGSEINQSRCLNEPCVDSFLVGVEPA